MNYTPITAPNIQSAHLTWQEEAAQRAMGLALQRQQALAVGDAKTVRINTRLIKQIGVLLANSALATTLAACGGGDFEHGPDSTRQPVDCRAKPEQCA